MSTATHNPPAVEQPQAAAPPRCVAVVGPSSLVDVVQSMAAACQRDEHVVAAPDYLHALGVAAARSLAAVVAEASALQGFSHTDEALARVSAEAKLVVVDQDEPIDAEQLKAQLDWHAPQPPPAAASISSTPVETPVPAEMASPEQPPAASTTAPTPHLTDAPGDTDLAAALLTDKPLKPLLLQAIVVHGQLAEPSISDLPPDDATAAKTIEHQGQGLGYLTAKPPADEASLARWAACAGHRLAL